MTCVVMIWKRGFKNLKKGETNGNHVFWGLELPESDIDSNTTFALRL